MKKLITLLLVLTGMVGTVSAKTIYFANNFSNINSLKLHLYTGGTNNGWPGADFPSPQSYTIDGYSVYALDLGNYENFIITFKFNDNDSWQRQSQSASSSAYEEGDYIDFTSNWNNNEVALTSALTVYNYSFEVSSSISPLNLYVWNSDGITLNGAYPGNSITGEGFSCKSFKENLNVIYNQGNEASKTIDMTAIPGTNKYFICGMNNADGVWGEAVKTNAAGYATYVSTKNLEIPENTAYCAKDNENGSATAYAVTNPAGSTAMLIKGNANTTYHFGTRSADSNESLTYTNAFKAGNGGTIAGGSGPYNYVLNGDAFFLAKSSGTTVASGKAYLQLSKQAGAGSNARVLIFPDDDETQGINAIPTAKANDGAYYNLSGQRVNAPTKGLYIQNGKKMIVK